MATGVENVANELIGRLERACNEADGTAFGEHSAVQSLVLVRGDDGWQIAGFHNTLVAPQRR